MNALLFFFFALLGRLFYSAARVLDRMSSVCDGLADRHAAPEKETGGQAAKGPDHRSPMNVQIQQRIAES